VTAHRDDPCGTRLLRGKHRKQTDRAVTHDGHGLAGPHFCSVGCEPAGAHHVGDRKQVGDHVLRRHIGRRYQRSIREGHPQDTGLRRADELTVHARGLIARTAIGTGVVGGEERADDELARPD
jgi:hypothetical protein